MTNKTIASLFVGSFVLCILGYIADQGEFFLLTGGLGLIASAVLASVRLINSKKGNGLGIALAIISAIFFTAAISGVEESALGISAIAFWVISIWAIVHLYKTPEKK